jgi:hypothetical protein
MSYGISTRLKNVDVAKTDESPTGFTLAIGAKPTATKQKGFIDVVAKGGGKTKKTRISVSVVAAAAGAVDPAAVAVTQAAPNDKPPATQAPTAPTSAAPAPPPPPAAPQVPQVVGSFSINAAEPAFTMQREQDRTVVVAVTPAGGYNGAPIFDHSQLPAGTIAKFSESSSKSGTKLTFTTSKATPRGTFPITVSGRDGTLQANAVITLTVRDDQTPRAQIDFPNVAAAGGSVPVRITLIPAYPDADVPAVRYDVQIGTGPTTTLGTTSPGTTTVDAMVIIPKTAVGTMEVVFTSDKFTPVRKSVSMVRSPPTLMYPLELVIDTFTNSATGNYSVPITFSPIAGMELTWGPVRGSVNGMLPNISGSGNSFQLNVPATGLPLGTYVLNATATNPADQQITVTVTVRVVKSVIVIIKR